MLAIERYDPRKENWTTIGSMPGRKAQFAVAMLSNKLYVIGGRDGLKTLNTVDYFDVQNKAWGSIPSMSTPRHGLGVTVLDGPIYAVGGA